MAHSTGQISCFKNHYYKKNRVGKEADIKSYQINLICLLGLNSGKNESVLKQCFEDIQKSLNMSSIGLKNCFNMCYVLNGIVIFFNLWVFYFMFIVFIYINILIIYINILYMCYIYILIFGQATQHVGTQFPDQRSNPQALQWKCRVLITGPPRKSPQ